jgi:putative peptidoglycan lipid II flippase
MKLYRAFATVSGLTMVSRILGFGRDILIAKVLGTGAAADSFVVAFQFPNLFRRLFGEGAFNSAFVPLFTDKLAKDGRAEARTFAEDALAGLLFVLLVLSAVAIIAMPWLMYVIAPGFSDTPAKFELSITMTQITFPYLICMSLVALLSGVLNALGRFSAAAAAPILLNLILMLVMLAALWLGATGGRDAGLMLAWGVTIAGIAQLFMMAVAAYRAGMGLGLKRPRLTPEVRQLVKLGVPGVVSGGITQINLLIGGIIASFQDGARAFLYYADRLYQLPLGVVGVAVGVVLLPDLVRHLSQKNETAALDSQNRSLEFAGLLTIPAAVGLVVLANPLIAVLFQRGAFTAADVPPTAAALGFFALGLPAFVIQKVFQPGYFARQDTVTPMRFAAINFTINVVASLLLFVAFTKLGMMPHVGIAIATTLAGWVNAILLWRGLVDRGHFTADARLKRNLPLIVLASLVMGASLWLAQPWFAPYLDANRIVPIKFGALFGLIVLGAAVFFACAQVTGVVKLSHIRKLLSRKRPAKTE